MSITIVNNSNCFENITSEYVQSHSNSVYDSMLSPDEKKLGSAVWELRRLEEKLFMWKEVRKSTISDLRSIADYIESLGYQTNVAKVMGASGGVLASGLTIVGGVMTFVTAGTALPFLVAGAGLGLASGLTGSVATFRNKILSSRQMEKVNM